MDFNVISNDTRIPIVAVEFDTSQLGNTATGGRKVLVIGQKLAAGTEVEAVLKACPSAEIGDARYGRGSMLAQMIRFAKAANRYADIWAIALDDAAAAVAATGTITFTGPATAAGPVCLMIGGVNIKAAVAKDDTPTEIATAVKNAINANDLVAVTAESALGVVTVTARNKGELGNTIDLRTNYYTGEELPAGVGATIVAMAAGATNPDMADAIAVFSDERWDAIISPYTDAANMALLEAELLSRWENIRVKAGLGFTAFRGNHGATSTFGNSRNSPLVSCLGTNLVPDPPYLWAAVDGAVADRALGIDPARQLRTLVLTGLKPPAVGDRWDDTERNLHLFDGISTYTVDAGGLCRIERQVTMYQKNAADVADDSLLDITTPALMIAMAIDLSAYFTSKYPRHKLADDGNQYREGEPVVTPTLFRAEIWTKALEWYEKAWIENLDQFKTDLVVERDTANRNRMNILCPPDLINNLMQLAILLQPRL